MSERGAAEHHGEQPGPLLMRAGRRDVTPERRGPLAGYEARGDAISEGAADRLEVALIVLDDGSERVAWLALDSIAVTADLASALREAVRSGLADDDVHVVTVASHTHAAPRAWVGSIHPGHRGEVDRAWVADLVTAVSELAEAMAREDAETVRVAWGEHRTVGFAANRLDPEAPYRGDVGVMTLRSERDGTVRALVFDVANHPTVLGPGNMRWSADWPGAARPAIAAAVAQGERSPVVVFLQGAAGDVSSRFTRRGSDESEVRRIGSLAASAAVRAVTDAPIPVRGPVRFVSRVPRIPRRVLPSPERARQELDEAVAARDALRDLPPLDPRVRLAQSRIDGARVQSVLVEADTPQEMDFPISATAIGDTAWVHLPVELFTSVAARIQERSPFPVTRVIGYADGYLGYMADASAHATASYEALSSLFTPEASDRIVDEALTILKEIR